MKNACCYGFMMFLGFIYFYVMVLMPFLGQNFLWMVFVVPIALGILMYVGAKQTHKKAQLETLARLNAELSLLEHQMAEEQARAQGSLGNNPFSNAPVNAQPPSPFVFQAVNNAPEQPAFIPVDDHKVSCPSCGAVVDDDGAAFCGNCGGKL